MALTKMVSRTGEMTSKSDSIYEASCYYSIFTIFKGCFEVGSNQYRQTMADALNQYTFSCFFVDKPGPTLRTEMAIFSDTSFVACKLSA